MWGKSNLVFSFGVLAETYSNVLLKEVLAWAEEQKFSLPKKAPTT